MLFFSDIFTLYCGFGVGALSQLPGVISVLRKRSTNSAHDNIPVTYLTSPAWKVGLIFL